MKKIVCLGGGPAGLYFAISMKLRDPNHQVTVIERNKPDDTFGWGVVLSDDAMENLRVNDIKTANAMKNNFAYWDDISVSYKGHRMVSGGHGFTGIGRRQMLVILQQRAQELGVEMQFSTKFSDLDALSDQYDLVVAADGISSWVRKQYEDVFKPNIDIRQCKFVWLGTHQKFNDAFTFIFEATEHGWMWIHAYQFDADTATVIVECTNENLA